MPPEDTAYVRLEQDTLLLDQDSRERLTVRWDPQSILPTMEPSSYTVDIALFRFFTDSDGRGEYRHYLNLMRDQDNNGMAMFFVPENNEVTPNVYPVAVRISVGRSRPLQPMEIIDRLGRSEEGAMGAVAQWTSTLYYAVSLGLEELCRRWSQSQPTDIGETIRTRLPPCPPRVDQARAPNSGFKEELGYWTQKANSFFHPGAATCFRQNTFARLAKRSVYDHAMLLLCVTVLTSCYCIHVL